MNHKIMTLVMAGVMLFTASTLIAEKDDSKKDDKKKETPTSVVEFEVKDIDGKDTKLSKYKGKVWLMVNVASKCGYTKQYKGLQDLHDKYAKSGLVVMGFPANNFGGQEPGSDLQIKNFCKSTFGVEFPMFSKVSVKGKDKCDLYQFLTDKKKVKASQGEIRWNFEKFLVDREGNVVKHYRSKAKPADIAKDIEKLLKKKPAKKKA